MVRWYVTTAGERRRHGWCETWWMLAASHKEEQSQWTGTGRTASCSSASFYFYTLAYEQSLPKYMYLP